MCLKAEEIKFPDFQEILLFVVCSPEGNHVLPKRAISCEPTQPLEVFNWFYVRLSFWKDGYISCATCSCISVFDKFLQQNWFSKELQTCWADAPGLLHCLRLWFPCNHRRRRFAPGKNVTFDHLTFRFSETINYLFALCYIFIPGIRILTPKIVIPAAAAAASAAR